MKKLLAFTLLTIAFLGLSAIPLYGQTACDTTHPYCHTKAQEQFYVSQVQRAKEYSAKIILLQENAKDDSLQQVQLKKNIGELQGQLTAKDTLISTANQKEAITAGERDRVVRQKKGWKFGFISSWAAIVAIVTYKEIKKE